MKLYHQKQNLKIKIYIMKIHLEKKSLNYKNNLSKKQIKLCFLFF